MNNEDSFVKSRKKDVQGIGNYLIMLDSGL